MVSNQVVHRNQRERWFVGIVLRNRLVSRGIGVVMGHRARCSWWTRSIGDGWQVTQTIGDSWQVTGWIGVVGRIAWMTGRDCETISVVIVT